MWKTKTYDVTPARDPALREPKAGGQNEKAGFPLEFIPHTMRGGNDKYCFRNRSLLSSWTEVKSQELLTVYILCIFYSHSRIFRTENLQAVCNIWVVLPK